MPDRTRNLLLELATSGPPDPLLLWHLAGCYDLPTVDLGPELLVRPTKDCHIGRPRWTFGFELPFGFGSQRVDCPLMGGTAF